MTFEQERARFCDSCSAVIGWYATYCEECGMRVGDDPADMAGPVTTTAVRAEVSPVQQDLFTAHMRVIHRHRERVATMKKALQKVRKRVQKSDTQPTADTPRELIALSDRVLELEQEWEDIQRSYNRQSENIEEDFLDRIQELEADIELPPEHQEAIQEEIRALVTSLESSEEETRELARHLDILRGRQMRGTLGSALPSAQVRMWALLGFFLAMGGFLLGVAVFQLSPALAGAVAGPGILGVLVMVIGLSRSR